MSEPSYEMQVAIAAALLADATVVGLVGNEVLDELDATNAPYPRIEIGDSRWLPDTNSCADPGEQFETLEIWASGPGGRLLAKQIALAVLAVIGPQRLGGALLPPDLNPVGFTVTSAVVQEAKHSTDVDQTEAAIGRVARSTLTIAYQLTPSA